jgi:hypothetical protein
MNKLTINPLEAILTSSKKRRVKFFPYLYGFFILILCNLSSGFGFENLTFASLILIIPFNIIIIMCSLFFIGWSQEEKEDASFYLYKLMKSHTREQIHIGLVDYSNKRKRSIIKSPEKVIYLITPLVLLLSGNVFTFFSSIVLSFIIIKFKKDIDVIVNDAIVLCESVGSN